MSEVASPHTRIVADVPRPAFLADPLLQLGREQECSWSQSDTRSPVPPRLFYNMYLEVAHRNAYRRQAAAIVVSDAAAARSAVRRSIVGRCMCDVFQYVCVLGLPLLLCFVSLLLLGLRLDERVPEWQVDGVGDASWICVFMPAAVGFGLVAISWCSMVCMKDPGISLSVTPGQHLPTGWQRRYQPCRSCIGCNEWRRHPVATHVGRMQEHFTGQLCACSPLLPRLLLGCVPCTGGAGLVLLGIRAAAAYSDSNVNATALHSVSWVVVMLPSAIFLCCFWGMMASSSTPVTLQLHEERVKRVSALCCCVLPVLCTLILLGLYLNELEADGGSAPFDQLFVVTPMFVAVGCIALGLVVTLIRALREHDDEDAGITLWALYGLYICAGSMFAGVLLGQAVLVASMLAGDPNGIGYTVSLIPALLLSVVSAVGAARYGCRVYCTRRMLGHPFLGYLAHAGGPVQGCCGIFAAYGHSTNTDVGQLYAMYEHEAYIGSQLARLEQAFLDAPVPESVRGGLDAGRAWMMDKAIPV
mgnify:CR=1 FL=1